MNREDWLLHCYAPEISKEAYWILMANPNVDSVNYPPDKLPPVSSFRLSR